MRGTTGCPEIASLVRNQKGNQKESVKEGEDGNPERRAGEEGGAGWLLGVRMCATVCVSE